MTPSRQGAVHHRETESTEEYKREVIDLTVSEFLLSSSLLCALGFPVVQFFAFSQPGLGSQRRNSIVQPGELEGILGF